MKRALLLTAVALVAASWSQPAHAQFGLLDLGAKKDGGKLPDNQKGSVKKKQAAALPPPPLIGSTRSHSLARPRANSSSADPSGRLDLAGHLIGGYPAIRGELTGPGAARVSRGGANGVGGRSRRH
jgi:hypothetical protein